MSYSFDRAQIYTTILKGYGNDFGQKLFVDFNIYNASERHLKQATEI